MASIMTSDPLGGWSRILHPGPRLTLLAAFATLEIVALVLWPTIFLIDGSDGSTRLGTMFVARYSALGPLVSALKSGVDWIFPGALWSWEALGNTLFWCTLVAFAAYAFAAWTLTKHTLGLRWVLIPLVILQVTLVFVPASMTTDIYNYALYGEMPILYGANPFVHTPAEFPQSPLFYLIPLYWHDAPSVYGPLWVAISVGVASLFRGGPLADELLAYRLIANSAHLVNAFLVWSLARRLHPERAESAALAYAWNPLLLVDFVLNGHNDVLMLTFMLASFRLALGQRSATSAAMLGLSIATKYTSALAGPLLFFWMARQHTTAVRGGLSILGGGLIILVVLAALYSPWIEGPETFGPVLYWVTGPRLNNFWPEPMLINLASWAAGLLGTSYDQAWDTVLTWFKLAAKVGLAAYIVHQTIVARRFEDVLAGSARIMIAFLLVVNTWLMPWYYTWPLAIAAALGWHSALVRVCAGFTLTAMITMYQRQYGQSFADPWGGLLLVLPVILLAVPPFVQGLRARLRPKHRRPRLTNPPAVPAGFEPPI